ncbi:MAG: adenylate/guanylate cyclase domain-containing protein [Candidatus Rokubacteria bacterium]|nr:adenylate/guanylate cyclase domain-containing protein [Candidatus Rokubacteria bacterium]
MPRSIRSDRWRILVASLIGLAAAALLTAGFLANVLATTRAGAGDLLFRLRPAHAARSTVIVGIDQRSYQALLPEHGPVSAWPRTLYARALAKLEQAGPRVIGFAVFFDASKPEDAELAAEMRRAGNVVMPVVAQGPRAFDPRPGVAQAFDVFARPTPAVRDAAAAEGVANITTARDSVVRSLPLLLEAGGIELPSLALTIVARFARRPSVIDAPPAAGRVFAAGRAIPTAERDTMLINFLGPPSEPGAGGPFPIVSFVDVLEGRFDPGVVRDRIVLLGPTIRGVDEHATPTTSDTRMWGVEILANAVETILTQRFLAPAPPAVTVALIALMALGAALAVAAWRPVTAGLAVLALLALYLMAAAALLESGTVLDLVYPPAALFLALAAALAYRVVFEESEQRVLREAMSRYLSPSVSQWVLADPGRLRLGGDLREMTVLFSDVRHFTALAHALPPETLVALLNEYRTAMTEVVLAQDGVLAQYAGDTIEAFWNAPMAQPDHARRACQTALDMVAKLAELRPAFGRRGWTDLDLGIGINTGEMVVGNMGSRHRLDYSAVGDPVNVAARLEGLSKEYGARIVIGEATRAAAGPAFTYRFLDVVAVVGRSEPVTAHEVLCRSGDLGAAAARRLARYHEAVALYRDRCFDEAAARFASLAEEAPEDGPTALYRRRAAELRDHPPPRDWDGVYVARTK